MIIMCWILALAGAQEPAATITDDGAVVGTTVVPMETGAVIEKLSDPIWVSDVHEGGTKITIIERSGPCLVADYLSPSAVMAVRYRVRRCKLADGYEATLVDSNAFKAYRTRWTLTPVDGATQIHYRLEATTKLAVPQSWVRKASKKSILDLMEKLTTTLSAAE